MLTPLQGVFFFFLPPPECLKPQEKSSRGHLFMHQRLHLPLTLGKMDG